MNTVYGQRRILITSMMVTVTVGVLAGFERGEGLPTARFIIGVGMAYTICSIMVDLGSPMGAGFAALIMVAALLYQGEDAFRVLGRRSRPTRAQRREIRRSRHRPRATVQSPDEPIGGDFGLDAVGDFVSSLPFLPNSKGH